MSDIKCPFCGKHIRYLGTDLFTCDACHIMLPAKHWIAYINTRKALDVARNGLEYIFGYEGVPKYVVKHIRQVLDQIKNETALEQKE